MAFNQTYAEALEKARSKPQKPRKAMSRGKGFQAKPGATGLKQTRIGCATASRRKVKGKRKKLPSIKSLRKRVWAQFSIFIRTRDADEFGIVTCCTCPARHHWGSGQIHAGHWIHGRLDFDERNISPQCRNCNYFSNTKVNVAYAIYMVKKYGQSVMEELQLLSNTKSNKYNRDELNQLLAHYKTLNAANPLVVK